MNKRDFKKYVESVGDSACASMAEVYDSVEKIDKAKDREEEINFITSMQSVTAVIDNYIYSPR